MHWLGLDAAHRLVVAGGAGLVGIELSIGNGGGGATGLSVRSLQSSNGLVMRRISYATTSRAQQQQQQFVTGSDAAAVASSAAEHSSANNGGGSYELVFELKSKGKRVYAHSDHAEGQSELGEGLGAVNRWRQARVPEVEEGVAGDEAVAGSSNGSLQGTERSTTILQDSLAWLEVGGGRVNGEGRPWLRLVRAIQRIATRGGREWGVRFVQGLERSLYNA